MSIHEKSCGAAVYRINGGRHEYLIIFNKKGDAPGHWGFPKGHVENGETEDQTAIREIAEETGLTVELDTAFRAVSEYSPHEGVTKAAVYFVARALTEDVVLQKSEAADYMWADYETALDTITHKDGIIQKAEEYISRISL